MNILLIIAKTTVVLATAWILLALMRRASASVRHHVVALALAAALLIPLLEVALPSWEILPAPIGVMEAPAEPMLEPATVSQETPVQLQATTAVTPPSSPVEALPVAAKPIQWAKLLIVAWAIGAAGLLLLLLVRLAAMQFAVKRATPIEGDNWQTLIDEIRDTLNVSTPVSVRIHGKGRMPAVWGFRKAVVLLPAECMTWNDERRRAVLSHEIAHVARRDVTVLTLGHLACALHWFNPLVWMLQQRLAIEREHACDDLALTRGMPAARYADHLLTIAVTHRKRSSFAPVMAAQSQLEGRIMAILDSRRNRQNRTTPLQLGVALLALAALLPLSTLSWAQTEPQSIEIDVRIATSDSARFEAKLKALGIAMSDTDRLIDGLNDGDAVTRGACAWALGSSDDPRAIEPLIRATSDTDATARQWAIRSLGDLRNYGGPRVAAALIDRLTDIDAEVRQWAVRKLDGYDAAQIEAPLAGVILDDDAEVREWTVRTLGNLSGVVAQSALRDSLNADSSAAVREWAARGLNPVDNRAGTDALIDALRDEDAAVRQWSIRTLSDACDAGVVDALLPTLSDSDSEVRQWGVRVLGRCGDSRAIQYLRPLLDDEDDEVREWADKALKSLDV